MGPQPAVRVGPPTSPSPGGHPAARQRPIGSPESLLSSSAEGCHGCTVHHGQHAENPTGFMGSLKTKSLVGVCVL